MLFVNPGCRWNSLLLVALVGLVLKPYPDLQATALDITLCRHSHSWGCLGHVQSVPPINSKSTGSFLSKQMGMGWVTGGSLKILPNPSVSLHLQVRQCCSFTGISSHSLCCHPTHVSWVSYSCPIPPLPPSTKKSKNQISLRFIRKVQCKKICGFVVVILGICN